MFGLKPLQNCHTKILYKSNKFVGLVVTYNSGPIIFGLIAFDTANIKIFTVSLCGFTKYQR